VFGSFSAMPFYFVGAGSPSKLQSKPIRWLFLDEVRNYPPGALDTVLKRTRAVWNSRRLIISTPDRKDDAVYRAYLAGDQRLTNPRTPASELKAERRPLSLARAALRAKSCGLFFPFLPTNSATEPFFHANPKTNNCVVDDHDPNIYCYLRTQRCVFRGKSDSDSNLFRTGNAMQIGQ
jgi:hypothetical protein